MIASRPVRSASSTAAYGAPETLTSMPTRFWVAPSRGTLITANTCRALPASGSRTRPYTPRSRQARCIAATPSSVTGRVRNATEVAPARSMPRSGLVARSNAVGPKSPPPASAAAATSSTDDS